MAGDVYPKGGPRPTTSNAEVAFYEALRKHLPDGWTAWHSLKLRISGRWEGEGDFVVAAPDRGLVVFEVKGGVITLKDGRWYQNSKLLDPAPRDQALRFARRLAEKIRAQGLEAPPFDAACAFPDSEFSEGPTNGDLEGLVVGPHQLKWLGEALPALLDRALGARRAPRNRKWMGLLHAMWGHTWVPHVRLSDRADRAAERAIELDKEQLRLLDMAGQVQNALVTGRAGSGKTVVARELCLRRAADGKRALYLCFTKALGRVVDESFEPARAAGADIRAVPIRRYACELLGVTRAESTATDKEFWDAIGFRAAVDALPADADRPDIVVVDEAQDLDANDWTLVEELARGRSLWVFYDDAQQFWWDRAIPEEIRALASTPLTLPGQHRNPERIDRFAASYRTRQTSSEAGDSKPTYRRAKRESSLQLVSTSDDRLLTRVERELAGLISKGAKPSDIAILTLAGQTKSALLARTSLAKQRLVRADADDAPTHVIADTFLRFKGLERPFIIVTEVMRGAVSKYDTRMHIALTRATVTAIVVYSEEAAAADPRLNG